MGEMTPRERLISAACLEEPDGVPVQPELWDDWTSVFFEVPRGSVPLWKLQIKATNYFKCDGWFCVSLGKSQEEVSAVANIIRLEDGSEETKLLFRTPRGDLQTVTVNPIEDAGFVKEGLVKNLEQDLDKLDCIVFVDPWTRDTSQIGEASRCGGDSGVVSVGVSTSFFDFWAAHRDGGYTQAIYDFFDYPELMKAFHEKFSDFAVETAQVILTKTEADEILGTGANASITNPKILEEWDAPVIKRVLKVCKEYGVPFQCHIHGKCRECLPTMAKTASEVSMPITVSPLEPPPKGNIDDWEEIKQKYGHQLCLRGSSIDTLRILAQGTPKDVEREVRSTIIKAADSGGLIVSGEGEPRHTPLENMWAYIKTARKFGRYPISHF